MDLWYCKVNISSLMMQFFSVCEYKSAIWIQVPLAAFSWNVLSLKPKYSITLVPVSASNVFILVR